MKHTKGEWNLSSDDVNKFIRKTENIEDIIFIYCVDNSDHIAGIQSCSYNNEEALANAKLIAASPDMLIALICEQIMEKRNTNERANALIPYGYDSRFSPQDFVDSLRIQAIKKATL